MRQTEEILSFSENSPRHFFRDVIAGLKRPQKILPGKYFYDDEGNYLLERISQTPEYYLTRTEVSILREHAHDMAQRLGEKVLLIEYGNRCGENTGILLSQLKKISAYVPIDMSQECLQRIEQNFAKKFPYLDIFPVCADFSSYISVPSPQKCFSKKVVYFPGSSIGNFSKLSAAILLRKMTELCLPGDGFLIGIDLKKDPELLRQAYNDQQGYTEHFNLNILRRINRELGGDFALENFRHMAFYNHEKGRVEMHLVSIKDQEVRLRNVKFSFKSGESIHSESAYKFDLNGFERITQFANLKCVKVWTDPRQFFGIVYLTLMPPRSQDAIDPSTILKAG